MFATAAGASRVFLVDVAEFATHDLAVYRAMSAWATANEIANPDLSTATTFADVLRAWRASYHVHGVRSLAAVPTRERRPRVVQRGAPAHPPRGRPAARARAAPDPQADRRLDPHDRLPRHARRRAQPPARARRDLELAVGRAQRRLHQPDALLGAARTRSGDAGLEIEVLDRAHLDRAAHPALRRCGRSSATCPTTTCSPTTRTSSLRPSDAVVERRPRSRRVPGPDAGGPAPRRRGARGDRDRRVCPRLRGAGTPAPAERRRRAGRDPRRTTDAERRALVDGLLRISGRWPPIDRRPVELTVVVQADVRPWRYPPVMDLQFGEWLRADLERGLPPDPPSPTPDLAPRARDGPRGQPSARRSAARRGARSGPARRPAPRDARRRPRAAARPRRRHAERAPDPRAHLDHARDGRDPLEGCRRRLGAGAPAGRASRGPRACPGGVPRRGRRGLVRARAPGCVRTWTTSCGRSSGWRRRTDRSVARAPRRRERRRDGADPDRGARSLATRRTTWRTHAARDGRPAVERAGDRGLPRQRRPGHVPALCRREPAAADLDRREIGRAARRATGLHARRRPLRRRGLEQRPARERRLGRERARRTRTSPSSWAARRSTPAGGSRRAPSATGCSRRTSPRSPTSPSTRR